MSTFKLIHQNNNNYSIEGELTFNSLNKRTIPSSEFLKKTDAVLGDLEKGILFRLFNYGVKAKNVTRAKACTCCEDETFFS